MRHQPVRRPLARRTCSAVLPNASARSGEDVGSEQVVVIAERVERVQEADEVGRDEPGALMDQLVEAVLAVRAGLTPSRPATCRTRPAGRPASRTCRWTPSVSCCKYAGNR